MKMSWRLVLCCSISIQWPRQGYRPHLALSNVFLFLFFVFNFVLLSEEIISSFSSGIECGKIGLVIALILRHQKLFCILLKGYQEKFWEAS